MWNNIIGCLLSKNETLFGFSNFGHRDLFDILDLVFGTSISWYDIITSNCLQQVGLAAWN